MKSIMGLREESEKLKCRWSKGKKDLLFYYPNKADGHFLHGFFSYNRYDSLGHEYNFIRDLESRGYDITTLKFEISKREK